MDVYWLEQTALDVPADDDWLSEAEALRLKAMRIPKRRADWRLGRWTAKQAVAEVLGLSTNNSGLASIEVHPAPSGAPEVTCHLSSVELSISLSHSSGVAACAVAVHSVAVGCDVERVEPRSAEFISDYFTIPESLSIARFPEFLRPHGFALLWSGKESALKVLRVGLRADVRSVTVSFENSLASDTDCAWHPLCAVDQSSRRFQGWWLLKDQMVRTIFAEEDIGIPIDLRANIHTPA